MDSFGKSLGASTGCKVVNLIAGGVITAKYAVAIDTAATNPQTVIMATDVLQPIGIALEAAAAAGDVIAVAVVGKVEDAVTDTAVDAAGKTLVADASGQLTYYANTSVFSPFAMSLEADTTVADVWLFGLGLDLIGV